MQKKINMPEIRFKQFSGESEWEKEILGDIVEFFSGLTYSPDNVTTNGTFVLRSSNVKNGEIVTADNVYVHSKFVTADNVQVGDVIVVVRNGSRGLIGKHAQVKKQMENTVIGAFMTGVRSDDPNFINSMLSTQQFDIEVSKNLGATINQITIGAFKKMKFYVPKQKKEKGKIGNFFNFLDELIYLNQRKLDKMTIIKKAMLEKMFPKDGCNVPEIRFKQFAGENASVWEQEQLGNLGEVYTGNTPLTSENDNWTDNGDGHIWITPTDINSLVTNNSERHLTDKGRSKARVIPENSVLITCIASIGKNTINAVPAAFNQQINAIIPEDNDAYFILSAMMKDTVRFMALAGQTATAIINKATFEKFYLMTPNYDEQTKIGSFFHQLDTVITLQQQKLKQLNNIKKALLEKMFV